MFVCSEFLYLCLHDCTVMSSQLEGFRWQPQHQARVLWANNLHILNQAIKEMSTKKNQTDSRSSRLYAVLVDFEKAFDSVKREAMWKEVKRYGVPKQIVNLIKET